MLLLTYATMPWFSTLTTLNYVEYLKLTYLHFLLAGNASILPLGNAMASPLTQNSQNSNLAAA